MRRARRTLYMRALGRHPRASSPIDHAACARQKWVFLFCVRGAASISPLPNTRALQQRAAAGEAAWLHVVCPGAGGACTKAAPCQWCRATAGGSSWAGWSWAAVGGSQAGGDASIDTETQRPAPGVPSCPPKRARKPTHLAQRTNVYFFRPPPATAHPHNLPLPPLSAPSCPRTAAPRCHPGPSQPCRHARGQEGVPIGMTG